MAIQTEKEKYSVGLLSRQCPVCQSSDTSKVYAEANMDMAQWNRYSFSSRKLPDYTHFRLLSCPECQLVYASPIPAPETFAQNYRDADFDTNVEGNYASRTYASLAKRILPRLPDLKGALDIGTGTGSFLHELLKLHFKGVIGIEPSHAPIAQANPEIRPLIKEGLFDPKDFSPASFSLISCFQTLEHLYDPLAMCQSAFRLLKPNGAVLFIFHNRKSLSARILGLKSPIFDVEHLQLFSPTSARFMLVKCGFRDIECRPFLNSYPIAYWIRLLPIPQRLKRELLKILGISRLGTIPIPLPAGNFVATGFKKSL